MTDSGLRPRQLRRREARLRMLGIPLPASPRTPAAAQLRPRSLRRTVCRLEDRWSVCCLGRLGRLISLLVESGMHACATGGVCPRAILVVST